MWNKISLQIGFVFHLDFVIKKLGDKSWFFKVNPDFTNINSFFLKGLCAYLFIHSFFHLVPIK